jgi:hypothetical protein
VSPFRADWLLATGKVVRMRSSATGATVKVLREFIDIYLEAGWTVIEPETKGPAMTERDELAKLLTETSRAYIGEYGAYVDEVEAPHLADAILAAGYSKPRTITTATELDALRRFTVIRSAEGVVYERQTMWHEAGSRDLVHWPAIALPVIVLQEGWGEE